MNSNVRPRGRRKKKRESTRSWNWNSYIQQPHATITKQLTHNDHMLLSQQLNATNLCVLRCPCVLVFFYHHNNHTLLSQQQPRGTFLLSFRSRISGIIQITTLFGYFDNNAKEIPICIQDQSMMTILKIIWSHNINTMLPEYFFVVAKSRCKWPTYTRWLPFLVPTFTLYYNESINLFSDLITLLFWEDRLYGQ